MSRCLQYPWHETTGDDYDCGANQSFILLGDDGWTIRQLEIYQNGRKLKYSLLHLADEFGMLSDKPVNFDDFANNADSLHEITDHQFELVWQS